MQNNLHHLAIILDGNARWAKFHGKIISSGHQAGAENAKHIAVAAHQLGVKYLTLYVFSSENWKRPKLEVKALLKLASYYLQASEKFLQENNFKLKIIGNLAKLPENLVKQIKYLEQVTKSNQAMTLCLAVSYGGREEMINACQKIILQEIKEINEYSFRNFLYDAEMPDVDLLIRTGSRQRISNFLLWQISYAEIFFSDKLWPAFTKQDLTDMINEYVEISRNFGGR